MSSYVLNTYARSVKENFVKGKGCYLYTDKGEKYLDFVHVNSDPPLRRVLAVSLYWKYLRRQSALGSVFFHSFFYKHAFIFSFFYDSAGCLAGWLAGLTSTRYSTGSLRFLLVNMGAALL